MRNPRRNPHTGLVIFALIVSTCLVYWQLRDHEFTNYDDNDYVTSNPHVQEGLTREGIVWAFMTDFAANWHPVTWLSHMADVELYGLKPAGHHLTNLFIHIANTALLFLVFRRMTAALWQSAAVAALFALHPLHVESVAWVAERKDVLSAFFGMLTIWAYVSYTRNPTMKTYLPVYLFFAVGLMAKPMLVTLPFVLLLLDYWPLNRMRPEQKVISSRRKGETAATHGSRNGNLLHLIREKVPLLLLALISSIVTFIAQQHGGTMQTWQAMPFVARLGNALSAYVGYIEKTLFPSHLSVFYPYAGSVLQVQQLILYGTLVVAISLLVIRGRNRFPYLIVGWCWFLGMLLPVIGLVQVGEQAMADRYMYMPLIGLSVMIAWGLPALAQRVRHGTRWLSVSALVIAPLLIGATWSQVGVWRDSFTLYDHAIRVTSNNWLAHNNLGTTLVNLGRKEEGLAHYREALRIKPDYALAHCNIGVMLAERGDTAKAIAHYNEAIRIKSDYTDAHINLGLLLVGQGKIPEAVAQYSEALKASPDNALAHYNLGLAFQNEGQVDRAVEQYREALRLKPDYAEAHNNLGTLLYSRKELSNAVDQYVEAIRLNPSLWNTHYNLALALTAEGKLDEAMAHYSEVLRLKPDNGAARTALESLRNFRKADTSNSPPK